jgi:dinuclear metal center YbgI/SA1388 family protein
VESIIMRLSDLVTVLNDIAPTRNAESWDNVGLLAGDPAQDVSKVMLTIDYTDDVANEARTAGCDVVVTYHPPIFEAVKRMTAGSLVFDAIRRGVALYSPHTALDVVDGGTNDMLADVLGLPADGRSPLRLAQTKASQYKLVTFVPEKDADRVSQALFDAGAGRIGAYTQCSFVTRGTGTFFGEEGKTSPAVGHSGRLERAEELRVETVVPLSKAEAVIRALRRSHPYEEPAFDLNQLAAPPEGLGQGRIGRFERPVERRELFERIRRGLELNHFLIAGSTDGPVTRAAVCAGACGDLLNDALTQKAELYLTGEMRHHDALRAARAGMTVVCVLHSNSERAVMKRLKARLEEKLPALQVLLSRSDRDPFEIR